MAKVTLSIMKKILTNISRLLSLSLIVCIASFSVKEGVIMAIDPLTLALILGGATTLIGGAGNQIIGNPRNVRKRRRQDLQQTSEQADLLFNTQLGKVKDEMSGVDQSLADLGNQYADLKNLDGSFLNELKKNYLDSTEGSAILNNIKDQSRGQRTDLRNNSNLMGLSEEAYIAGLGNINKGEGQATASLASNANNNRANLRGALMNIKNMMGANASTRSGINLNKGTFKSNLFGNSFNAASGIMNNTDQKMQNQLNGFNQSMDDSLQMVLASLGG